jgi:hypothetical protein
MDSKQYEVGGRQVRVSVLETTAPHMAMRQKQASCRNPDHPHLAAATSKHDVRRSPPSPPPRGCRRCARRWPSSKKSKGWTTCLPAPPGAARAPGVAAHSAPSLLLTRWCLAAGAALRRGHPQGGGDLHLRVGERQADGRAGVRVHGEQRAHRGAARRALPKEADHAHARGRRAQPQGGGAAGKGRTRGRGSQGTGRCLSEAGVPHEGRSPEREGHVRPSYLSPVCAAFSFSLVVSCDFTKCFVMSEGGGC